jgi:hypothetical protein
LDLPMTARPNDDKRSAVLEAIKERRAEGTITCIVSKVANSTSNTATADAAALSVGFCLPRNGWQVVDQAEALSIAVSVLHRDLAYSAPIMPLSEATELSQRFFELLPNAETFFTNGSWTEFWTKGSVSWSSISNSTLDAGVICVAGNEFALLWVEDED